MEHLDSWLDRAAKLSCIGSFIAQITFGVFTVKGISRAPTGDSRTLWFFLAWMLTTLISAGLFAAAFWPRKERGSQHINGTPDQIPDDFIEYINPNSVPAPPAEDAKSELERWCEALVHNDTSNMHQRVIAVSWEPRRVDERSNHYIEFKITFVNASIFELKSPRLGGIAKFDRHPLPFTPQFAQPFPLTRGQKTWMSIRQPLTKEIAEDMQTRLNREGVAVNLDFSDLEITFDVEFPGRPTWQWIWKGRDSVSVQAVTF